MTATERQARQETWIERIAEFEGSGLSGAKWCAARGLKEHQLSCWRRKLKYQAEQKEIRWLPVELSAPEPALTIKIGLASIELSPGFDQELFIKAVKLLNML